MEWLSWLTSNLLLAIPLAVAAYILQRFGRPAIAHVLWVLVLVKLVTPPLVSVSLNEPVCTACSRTADSFERDTLPWIVIAIWLTGVVVTSGIAAHRWLRFRRLIAHADQAPWAWQSLASRLSFGLSIRCPEILTVPGRLPPLIVPGHRPIMLLPAELMNQLTPSQQDALLMHELVHLKRRDHWVRILELLVSVAYWWLPVVKLIGRAMRACEEACCDAAVVAHVPHARRDYARLLLDVLDFTSPLPEPVTAMSTADLEQRLRTILDSPRKPSRSGFTSLFAAAAACAILPIQLHYDFTPKHTHVEPAVEVESSPTPNTVRKSKLIESCCCPT